MSFKVLFGKFLKLLVFEYKTNRNSVVVLLCPNLLIGHKWAKFINRSEAQWHSQGVGKWKMMLVRSFNLRRILHLLMLGWRWIIRFGRDHEWRLFVHTGIGINTNLWCVLHLLFCTCWGTWWPHVLYSRWLWTEIFCRICKTHPKNLMADCTVFGPCVLIWKCKWFLIISVLWYLTPTTILTIPFILSISTQPSLN